MTTSFTFLYLVFALYLNDTRCVLHPENVTDMIKGSQLSQEKENVTDTDKDLQLAPEEDNVTDIKEGPELSPEENVKDTNTRPQLSWYSPKADTTTEIFSQLGYRYNGLDLLLCPWSYTCGEPGSPVPSNQKIPSTCCTGG